MGAVAKGAADEGAKIVGIIPTFLREREMDDSIPPQEIFLTGSLTKRKSLMLRLADAFVALPGGYGTLDETLEVVSSSMLGIERKPLVLVNIDGFWDPFVKFVDELTARGFVPADRFFAIVQDPNEAIQYVESAVGSQTF
jgi:uncharacterized protein (TIGR00730 family)